MKVVVWSVLLLLAMTEGAFAQNVTLGGVVRDTSGGVLPGVTVTATQTDTGLTRATVTDENGLYTLSNLPVGPYRLEATLDGFRTFVQSGLVLQVGANPTINIVLEVGALAEQLEVRADAAMVETRSTGVGQVITNESVLSLPLNGRNVTELVMLSGTATDSYQGGNFVSNRQYPVRAISIAGGSPGGTYYAMDGGSHNDPGNNLNLPVPFPDALQEFKVETGAVPARYGQHANAVVNLITKSGTNLFHGSVFEFVRNAAFNARNHFALRRDSLKRNQFGGTIGGPIATNKLFFFGGYQGTIVRSDPSELQAFIPTPAMLAGDFTAAASPACNAGAQRTLTAPAGRPYTFTNNRIDPANFDPVALRYVQHLPTGSTIDACGRYRYGFPTPSTDKQYLAKVDYQMTDNHSIFGRYFYAVYDAPNFYEGNALTTTSIGVRNSGESLVLGDTYIFSPNVVNSLRVSYLTPRNDRFAVPFFCPSELGSNMYCTPFSGSFTSLSVTGAFNIGSGSTNNAFYNYWVYGVNEDLDIIRGNHSFSIGGMYLFQIEETRNSQFSNGQIAFNGQRTGLAMADFLLGEIQTISQGGDGVMNDRKHYLGLYFQDVWRASSRLTMNYGIRWEPNFPLYNIDGHSTRFDEAAFARGEKSTVYVNAPAGFTFPGDPGYPYGSAMTHRNLKVFSPRFGVVFDPKGEGREVIRAAYGLFVDSQPLFDHTFVHSNPPWGALIVQQGVRLRDPYATYPEGNPFPLELSRNIQFPQAGGYAIEQDHANQLYVQQWNLSYQRELASDVSLTVSYLGNRTHNVWSTVNSNPGIFTGPTATLANLQQRRRLSLINPVEGALIGPITQLDDSGWGRYHGFTASLVKRFSNDYSLMSNYTYGDCINTDDARQIQSQGGVYTEYGNSERDLGPCSTDIRHTVNLSGVISTPQFQSRLLNTVAGGWQLSTLFRSQSGSPFNVTIGQDRQLSGVSNQRPNQVGDPEVSDPTPERWFNTAAFELPAIGALGDTKRNSLRGPGFWTVDVALSRRFSPFSDAHEFELRAEAFNLFNTTNFNAPIATLTSPDFGRIRSARDPRIMQFAFKYVF
jgi:hypothetical protein